LLVSEMRIVLTAKFIAGLKATAPGKRAHYWDALVPGLGVRVTARGSKSFVIYRRWPGSRAPARRALGDATKLPLATARQRARDWLTMVERGVDPKEEARQAALAAQRARQTTFTVVAEAWFAEEVNSQRRAMHVTREVRREFFPLWGKRPITEITTLEIRDVIKAKATTAPAQARNLLGHLHRLFAWALAQHAYGLTANPAAALRPSKLVGRPNVRKRVLTDDELRALWQATTELDYPLGPLVQMLALTGQRRSEVAEARWCEFDLSKRLWTIPPERMKGNAAHVVPLVDQLCTLLAGLPRFKQGDYVFSTTFGDKPVTGFVGFKRRLDRLMSGEPFTMHDIRRTMRTHLSALPITDMVRELVIAHHQPRLHKVYDQHAYLEEKRHALELWAARLRDIVSPPPANVVSMRKKRVRP
jgi:integrase